jgi:asparagine synthase (glutamine-hydrolysing)
MNITLKNNSSFKWFKNDTLFFKGYFYVDTIFYEKENALNFLHKRETKVAFFKTINQLNGVYTIIVSFENTTFIITDTTRAFPLFYTSFKDQLYVSDDITHLKKSLPLYEFDALSEIELKSSLHTYGKRTLLKNVYQVQSDECLCIENNTIINNHFLFSYAIKTENSLTYKKLTTKAITVFDNSFKRLVTSLQNRTAVIPLSAGFDSRLIATQLKKLNYKNVICYTYGKKDSFEIENSKKVAKTLGFKWYFIEYTKDLIADFINQEEFKNYAHFAGKLSSTPNMQEFFAVKYLKENKLIPEDSIFIPGYAGDLLGGSQFLKVIPKNLKSSEIVDLIIKEKLNNGTLTKLNKKSIRKELENSLFNFDKNYLEKVPSSVFEDFDLKEKIAKYIFNSANFYTYFGFEHRFPFWDKETLHFFKSVPVKYKTMKTLFDDVLINHYFKTENVYFENEMQPSEQEVFTQKIKNKIKPIIPTFIKQKLLKKNDWNNYETITNKMLVSLEKNDIKHDFKSESYNDIIAQWYLYFSKNKIN